MTKIRDEQYLLKLGERIKFLRNEQGISTYQLSYDSDVPRSQITAIESGKINTTVCTIKAISKALNLSPSELLDFK